MSHFPIPHGRSSSGKQPDVWELAHRLYILCALAGMGVGFVTWLNHKDADCALVSAVAVGTFVASVLCGIWGAGIGIRLILQFPPPDENLKGFWKKVRYTVYPAYEQHTAILQFLLRMTLVIILSALLWQIALRNIGKPKAAEGPISASVSSGAQQTNDDPTAPAVQASGAGGGEKHRGIARLWLEAGEFVGTGRLGKFLAWAHMVLVVAYLANSIIWFAFYLAKRPFVQDYRKAPDFPGEQRRPPWGSVTSGWLDVMFVTVLACTSLADSSHFHLAYLIPLLGIWWASPHHRRIVYAILGALGLRIVGAIAAPIMLKKWGLGGDGLGFEIVPVGAMAVALVFWCVVALVVLLLRVIRESLFDQAISERYFRTALECLGEMQEHMVFAKNRKREFTYANSRLLNALTPILERTGFIGHDGERITKEHRPACLLDIKGKTDFDLGKNFDKEAYLRSDAEVLDYTVEEIEPFAKRLHADVKEIDKRIGSRDPTFADFEPTFMEPKHGGIWTNKVRLPNDASGKPMGLAGEAMMGYPEQVRRLTEHLNDSLPIYALMKKPDTGPGPQPTRIVWCNRLHLEKLAGRLRQLAQQEYKEDFSDWSAELLLQKVGDERGPTDKDLYQEDTGVIKQAVPKTLDPWTNYARDDYEVMTVALGVIQRHGKDPDIDAIYRDINDGLKNWAARSRKVKNYPTHGWIERHRFPGASESIWVEVRKWPWIERMANGAYEVKGVVVIFEDVTESHIRRNVVWRWTRRHLECAVKATTLHQAAGGVVPMGTEYRPYPISAVPLIKLELTMLKWFRKMVNAPTEKHVPQPRQKTTRELEIVIDILHSMERGCPVRVLGLDTPLVIEKGGSELFAIVLALLINAGQSTMRRPGFESVKPHAPDAPPACFSLEQENDKLVLCIADNGIGFEPQDKPRIMDGLCWGDGHKDNHRLAESDRVLMPGGGILLVKYLLRGLLDLEPGASVSDYFDITSEGINKGAKATVRIPLKCFHHKGSARLIPAKLPAYPSLREK